MTRVMAIKVPGSCFCKAVRFTVELPTLFCAHCHCSMCRRSHGAGYVTWIGIPVERFEIVQGEKDLVAFSSSDHGTRRFCGVCGSTLFCDSTRHPEYTDIVLANLDAEIDRPPGEHVFFSDRVGWVKVDDDLPKLGGPTGIKPLPDPSSGTKK